MPNKLLMNGRHIHLDVALPSAFVERVARAVRAHGHDPVDGEAVCFVFNEALSRLFRLTDGAKFDELVREGVFAFELELARRNAYRDDAGPGETIH